MSRTGMQRSLLVFARDPHPGRVKTRLIPALGAKGAAALYWRMLRQTLATAARVPARRELWLDRAAVQPRLRRLARTHAMPLRLQLGDDLGARMHRALADALDRSECAVLIGSDCPGFRARYLEAAFAALARHDAVIGPAADGGYVLIGLKRARRELFAGIPWGGGRVLELTRQRLRARRMDWHELPTLHDLDVPADLEWFGDLVARAGVASGVSGQRPMIRPAAGEPA